MRILVLGGNRFFGRHMVSELLESGHHVTLLNRGKFEDGFGDRVSRLIADRRNSTELTIATDSLKWDLIVDQICFTATEAREACRIFRDKTFRYVATSSASVYDDGNIHSEMDFDPSKYTFTNEASAVEDYQSAKRQMETVFTREASFEVVFPRPSFVVGVDDYTRRLLWHIERIHSGAPVYIPRIDMPTDFIRSDQLGHAMCLTALSKRTGAINTTNTSPLALRDLMTICESIVGRKANFAPKHEGDNHSPYGGETNLTMRTDVLQSLGYKPEAPASWMPSLVESLFKTIR